VYTQKIMVNRKRRLQYLAYSPFVFAALILASIAFADTPASLPENSIEVPHAQTISIKSISPVAQTTDLQILCILKHDPSSDKYIDAMNVFNQKLHGLLPALRDRGEFAGDFGETLLLTTPTNSITPKQLLLIGIGNESEITPGKLQLIGGIAAREAVRIKAAHVSFAPALRDQGSTRVDVADGDAAFTTGWILAYDTEKKLQSQGLSPSFDIPSLTIEAGLKFFAAVVSKVTSAVRTAAATIENRSAAPYTSN
jgi:hypothetical protein